MESYHHSLKAVIFDFDGTLTLPGALDFPAIKKALGCPLDRPILEFIQTIQDSQERQAALTRLDDFETQAAATSQPNPGAQEQVRWIKQHKLAVGLITRNSRASVMRALENFDRLGPGDFDPIITRDDPLEPKPSGDGILWAARHLQIRPQEILVVGDYLFDTQAGRAAGAATVLLDANQDPRLIDAVCDFRIQSLHELTPIVHARLPLPAGKLPNHLLGAYLDEFGFEDPSVVIKPGVGEDIAAVDLDGSQVLILKSDPITFATHGVGRYAVLVNANDIATAGAVPRWFLTTLLLPCGITPAYVRRIMQELADACRPWGITLCGGHTEITDAVQRPVVVGMMAGTVRRRELIDKKAMQTGDNVLLTKGVAVEGTAIIAREFEARLRQQGLSDQEINSSRDFLDQISILPEARLAARDRLAAAMHDVTEGGVATALEELSMAGQHKIAVDLDKIPMFPQTQRICMALGLDPLGLIGSGSLLICCRPQNSDRLINRLKTAGIEVARIGRVLEVGKGVEAFDRGQPVQWPKFEVDEITKLF